MGQPLFRRVGLPPDPERCEARRLVKAKKTLRLVPLRDNPLRAFLPGGNLDLRSPAHSNVLPKA